MSTEAIFLPTPRSAGRLERLSLNHSPVGVVLVLVLGGVLALAVVLPLLVMVWFSLRSGSPTDANSTFTLANYVNTFLNPLTYALLGTTALFTTGSLLVGLVLGAGLAWLVERTNAPFRGFAFVIVVLTGAMPSILFAMSWVFLLNARTGLFNQVVTSITGSPQGPFAPFSMTTLILVEGMRLVPTVFLMMVGLFHTMDPSLEEAAATSGARGFTTFVRVTLPMMLPGLLGIAIFIAAGTIGLFEIPAVLGMPGGINVFATRIYLATTQVPLDYGLATSLGSVAAVLGIVGLYFYHRMLRIQQRFTTVTGKGYRPRRINLGRWRYVAGGSILLYFVIVVLLPLFILVWSSLLPFYRPPTLEALKLLSWDAYRRVFAAAAFTVALRNTLVLIVVVPLVTMIVSAIVSWAVVRLRVPGRSVLDVLTFVPFTVPSIVLGLAFLLLALYAQIVPLYGTIWLIAIAHFTMFLAYGTRTMSAAVLQLHRELEEAGQVSGLQWFGVFRGITVPLLLPALSAGWLWIAVHSGRELTAALMLSSADSQPLSIRIWSVWQGGQTNEAAAMGVMLMLLVGSLAAGVRLLVPLATRQSKEAG